MGLMGLLVGLGCDAQLTLNTSPVPTRISSGPDADQAIAFWQERSRQHPRSSLNFEHLSDAYFRRARETGDVSSYLRAKEAVLASLSLHPQNPEAEAKLAGILYALHEFPEALDRAQALAESGSVRALAVVGDSHLALGHYQQAQEVYQRWMEQSSSASLLSRQAALAEATGHFAEALALVQQATEMAHQSGEYGETLAWHEFQWGSLLWSDGQWKQAQDHFHRALAVLPDYPLAFAGLAQVAVAQGNPHRAIQLYEEAIALIPQPDWLATLGDLYALQGNPERAEQQYQTVELITHLAAINEQIYNRQLVIFYCNHDRHLEEALDLALAELQVRQDVMGWDALAWAYFKNQQIVQAAEAIQQALSWQSHQASVYYHAGMIALAQNDQMRAQQLLHQALAMNPEFDPLQAKKARATLTLLNRT